MIQSKLNIKCNYVVFIFVSRFSTYLEISAKFGNTVLFKVDDCPKIKSKLLSSTD